MPFSNWKTIESVVERFGLGFALGNPSFDDVVEPSQEARLWLQRAMKSRGTFGSEAARCERLISVVLLEAVEPFFPTVDLWSHENLEVPGNAELCGIPDFIIAHPKKSFELRFSAPFLAVVEAKKDDFEGAWAQCLAAMVACQVLNHGGESDSQHWSGEILGIVTDGFIWQFGELRAGKFDRALSSLDINSDLLKILGFLRKKLALLGYPRTPDI